MHKDVVRQTRYMNVCLLFLEKKAMQLHFYCYVIEDKQWVEQNERMNENIIKNWILSVDERFLCFLP